MVGLVASRISSHGFNSKRRNVFSLKTPRIILSWSAQKKNSALAWLGEMAEFKVVNLNFSRLK